MTKFGVVWSCLFLSFTAAAASISLTADTTLPVPNDETQQLQEASAPQKWRESRGLVALWPKLRKEKIESVTFCTPDANELIERCNGYKELPKNSSFRWRNEKEIRAWPVKLAVPQEELAECVQIIEKAIKKEVAISLWPNERMLIVTNKGKYITWVQTELADSGRPRVLAQDWKSHELGRFLAKCCCPNCNYNYVLPAKKDIVAILLYRRKGSPPVALFGDQRMAEDLVFKPELFNPKIRDDPNGIIGITDLYKFGRICQFGVETRKENRKYVWDNELKPQKTFEGRVWLEKIVDAFETALKEAQEKGKYYPGDPDLYDARIVFMTRDSDCWKYISIGENNIYDDYIKSEDLAAYFDELGLTTEI